MTRGELRFISAAHATALLAIAVKELREIPETQAAILANQADDYMPDLQPACVLFFEELRDSHGAFDLVVAAGVKFRDVLIAAMEFRPVDAARVDIHG